MSSGYTCASQYPVPLEEDALTSLQTTQNVESVNAQSLLTTQGGEGRNVQESTVSISSSQSRAHSSERMQNERWLTTRASVWQRLKWGLILSIGDKKGILHIPKEELKSATATSMEVTIMGSALVLTLGLQVQEVVGGRGGFRSENGVSVMQYVFALSSSLSFALAMYSIVTSSLLLLSFATCPSRHADVMLRKFFGWLCTPKLCTLSAAVCLSIAALAGNFLGVEKPIAVLSTLIISVGLVLTVTAIVVIISMLRQFRHDLHHSESDTASTVTDVKVDQRIHQQGECHETSDGAGLNHAMKPKEPSQLLSSLTPMSATTGLSFRISQVPLRA